MSKIQDLHKRAKSMIPGGTQLLSKRPENKEVGLELFANNGCFLVDATYTPVNNIKGRTKKDDKILENLSLSFLG